MEQEKRKRGRPRIDTHLTEELELGRRQTVNKVYMYEGMYLITEAASEIPNGDVLWNENREARTVKSRDGILEQLGRMVMQDKLTHSDCVAVANLAIRAVMGGCTNREVENAVRAIRMAIRQIQLSPNSRILRKELGRKLAIFEAMGGTA